MYRFFVVASLSLALTAVLPLTGLTRERTLTPDERDRLKQVKTVLVKTIALTERGPADARPLDDIVRQRLKTLGLTVQRDATQPHDVVVKVKCEERKTRIGPSRYGGDADSLHAPSRSWKGPACQITYGFDGRDVAWRSEVRTPFDNATRAARKARVKNSGQFALTALGTALRENDFAYLLIAEWGHAKRLNTLLQHDQTPLPLKQRIIPLLGHIIDADALSALQQTLNDPALAPAAAKAMGHHGQPAAELLLDILRTSPDPALKVSAVKGLGEIATHNADIPVFTPLITALQNANTELPVQTELVRALGKLADQRATAPLTTLNEQAWTNPSQDPEMQALRDALSWSLWQLNPDAHAGE